MLFNKNIISAKKVNQYVNDAISAASDMGVEITFNNSFVYQIDELCIMIHKDLDYIRTQKILLDSIAIKNSALVFEYIKLLHPDENIVWHKNDRYSGRNTYPIYFKELVIFPKKWIIDSIVSGEPHRFSSEFKEAMNSKPEQRLCNKSEITKVLSSSDFDIDFTGNSIEDIEKIEEYITECIKLDKVISKEQIQSLGIIVGNHIKDKIKNDRLAWAYGRTSIGGESTYYLSSVSGSMREIFPIDWVLKYTLDKSDSLVIKFERLI